MKQLFNILCLCVFFLTACNDDDNGQTIPREISPYDTDENVDAPVVSCVDAFDLFRYEDFRTTPTHRRIYNLVFNGSGIGFAVDEDRITWRVTDNGLTWNQLGTIAGGRAAFLPAFATSETIYMIRSGDEGALPTLLRSDDLGENFWELPSTGAPSIISFYFSNAEEGLMLVNNATISNIPDYQLLATTDGGQTWIGQDFPIELGYADFFILEGRAALSIGSNLLLRDAATGTWEIRPYPVPAACCNRKVAFNGNSRGVMVAEDGTFYRTSDAGRSWLTDGLKYDSPAYLEVLPDGTVLMIINRYTVFGGDALSFRGRIIYESSDGGATWEIEKTDGGCGLGRSIFTTESGRLLSVGQEELVVLDQR